MPDVQRLLGDRVAAAIVAAFGQAFAGTDPLVRPAQAARFGDYQANVAMGLARQVGRPPREVAAAIVAQLDVADLCEPPGLAGPGFVNFTLRAGWLEAQAEALVGDARLGVATAKPRTVVVDYSAPNVAKEMHVGHLRTTIIGDALVRVLEFLGHRVVRQNHIGDWGTQFGMLIEQLAELGAAGRSGGIADLNDLYQQAQAKFRTDPAFAERARRRVVAFQRGDAASLALWRELVDASARYFAGVYARLGVTLSEADIRGESFYNPMLADVVAELQAKGLTRISQGALCVFPPGFAGRDGEPLPLIVRKSDGGYGYAATDLAALRYRVETLGADRLVYVVGAPQRQHFEMVFAVGRMAGWLRDGIEAEHVAFGSMLGPDGRPFRTRSGDSVRLVDLLDEAERRAAQVVAAKNPGLDEAARQRVARAVGVGAVKYADLTTDREKDYVFDLDRMLALDGNTAPYLQYAHARIASIFRRAGAPRPAGPDGHAAVGRAAAGPAATAGAVGLAGAAAAVGPVRLTHPAERALLVRLVQLETVLSAVADTLEPHRLCGYLYGLAAAFSEFYERCPVLRAGPAERRSRLALCLLTARTLRQGLELLGIEALDEM